uniref:Uncharacterized protein n=2 Tax=Chrysemys picta bellii TaxID=8478 RepID=A0A8C3HI77_CHRPI
MYCRDAAITLFAIIFVAAVKAFKDARRKPPKTQSSDEHKSEEQLSQKPKLRQHSNSNVDNQTHILVLKQQEAKTKVNVKTATNIENKQICERECEQKSSEIERTDSPGDLSLQTSEKHAVVEDQTEPTIDWPKRKKLTSANKFRITNKSNSDVSDMEEFDNKEYFDDSTEERFYNQSSDSEESDSDDDFFIGKVKKKKKKVADSDLSSAKEKKNLKEALLNKTKDSKFMTMQDVITEESKPSAKAMKLESVFCNSLSRSDQKSKNMKRNANYQTSKNRRTAFPKNELRVKRTHLAKAAAFQGPLSNLFNSSVWQLDKHQEACDCKFKKGVDQGEQLGIQQIQVLKHQKCLQEFRGYPKRQQRFFQICVSKKPPTLLLGIATLKHINGPSSLVSSAVANIGCFSGK